MASVGIIGLGSMGGRLAERLLAAGHEVRGYNRSWAKAEELIGNGLIWHDTPRELAAASDITISMVSDDAALDAAAAGARELVASG